MIICDNHSKIYLRWRDIKGNRLTETVKDYKPYFYIKRNSPMPEYFDYKSSYGVKRIRPTYEFGDWVNIENQPLVKVTLDNPQQIYDIRKKWDETYEADVSFSRKYCVDRMDSIKEYNLRKWYLDIETQVGGRFDGAINAITIYDNYDEGYITLTWWPFEPKPEIMQSLQRSITFFDDEKEMLESFINMVEIKDPDMFIGWFINGFDIPTILKRIVENKLNPRRLSPINVVKGVSHKQIFNTNYTNTAQPIKGRISYCLMSTFERLWIDSQRGTLPSLSLNYCSKLVLGDEAGKVKGGKFEGDEFFNKAWLEDTNIFLEYNRVDVELMVRIDEEMNISENSLALQRLLICPLDVTFYNTQMAASYFLRHADWKAPTGVKGSKGEYEAAFVMNPLTENTYGLHENIAVFDFKSLYPSMMASRNICWSTKNKGGEEVNNIDFSVPKNLDDWDKGNGDVAYVKEPLGLLPKAVLSLMKLRDEYKLKRKSAFNDEEYRKWDSAQMATKRVVNAFYGVLAKDGYGWGDMEMAASITASAREAMRAVAFKSIEYGYEVIYGHTDSIFVKVKNVNDAKQLCVRLNDYIRNDVFNEYVELEFEKFAETFFLSKKKNRYCGYLSWKDGDYLNDLKFFVMGFEMKKSNETNLAKGFQKEILQMVSSGKGEEEITAHARKLYLQITNGEVPNTEIIKRSRLRKSLDEYKSIAGGVAGIYYHNLYLDLEEIEVGDSYYFYTIDNRKINNYPNRIMVGNNYRQVEYIACKNIEDVINEFPPNWVRIAESEIIKKVSLIYDSMDWDLEAISRKGIQKKLEEWW